LDLFTTKENVNWKNWTKTRWISCKAEKYFKPFESHEWIVYMSLGRLGTTFKWEQVEPYNEVKMEYTSYLMKQRAITRIGPCGGI
jgi:hypothetical protein